MLFLVCKTKMKKAHNVNLEWTVPQLSIIIIYYSKWSFLIQWIMVMIVRWQSDLVNTNESLLPVCDKPYNTNKSAKQESRKRPNVNLICRVNLHECFCLFNVSSLFDCPDRNPHIAVFLISIERFHKILSSIILNKMYNNNKKRIKTRHQQAYEPNGRFLFRVLVGAPRARSAFLPQSTKPGALFRCSVATGKCEELLIDGMWREGLVTS